MSERQWTEEQLQVINADQKNIIVSAAAGSGKTAVLVEKATQLIRLGVKPEKLLLITFTNAAAAEMKGKIIKRLRNLWENEKGNPIFTSSIENIELMQISTIHSFCQSLVKKYFNNVGIDPFSTICEPQEIKIMLHEAFRSICNELYNENNEFYRSFSKAYNHEEAEKAVMQVYYYIMSFPDPFGWLEEKTDYLKMPFDLKNPMYKFWKEMLNEILDSIEDLFNIQKNMTEQKNAIQEIKSVIDDDMEMFHVKQSELLKENPDREIWNKAKWKRMPTIKNISIEQRIWKDEYLKVRKEIKNKDKEISDLLFFDREELEKKKKTIYTHAKALQLIIKGMADKYQIMKKQKKEFDFSDQEHYALEILNNIDIQEKIQKDYEYIFVDECQDISEIQNAIIQKIKSDGSHLFMVGDVKQSIYRFRQSDPGIFQGLLEKFTNDSQGESKAIYLTSNFRSTPQIIDTVNFVFEALMIGKTTELKYTDKQRLVVGRTDKENCPVVFSTAKIDDDSGFDPDETMADQIAYEIQKLTSESGEICEKKKYNYRDIVVLLPALSGKGDLLAERLHKRNIPVLLDASKNFGEKEEITAVKNLLSIVHNIRQDLPLIAVLKMGPFYFTDTELADIRLCCPEKDKTFYEAFDANTAMDSRLGKKCREAVDHIKEWKFLSETMLLGDFIRKLIHESGYYAGFGISENGKERQRNLRMLCEQAVKMESRGKNTLREFIDYMEEKSTEGDIDSVCELGEEDDLVRIMTMHKSKGLQFPVVICAGMDQKLYPNNKKTVSLHQLLGLTMHYRNPETKTDKKTLYDQIFNWKTKWEEEAEKIRLLYVAMTRAMDRLIVITGKEKSDIGEFPPGIHRISRAESMSDWILPVLKDNEEKSTNYQQGGKPYKIYMFEPKQFVAVEKNKNMHSFQSWIDNVLSAPGTARLWQSRNNDWKPAYLKTSVTALIRAEKDDISDTNEEESPDIKRSPEALRTKRIEKCPSFMALNEGDGSRRGVIVHHLLSLITIRRDMSEKEINEEVIKTKREMTQKNMISEAESKFIDENRIVRFFKSELGIRLSKSPEIRRELHFTLRLPEKGGMLLQGVIDCAFIESDKWVIIDYKTDRVYNEKEFVEEYRKQLDWYAVALEKLTGKKAAQKWLYSLSLNRGFMLPS